jgi:thymidine kinase
MIHIMNINNHKLQFSNSIKYNCSGKLHLIIGPMFAGKTYHLIENYNKCKICNVPCIVINHGDDDRYDENLLSTHDKKKIPCIKAKSLENIYNDKEKYNLNENSVVLINEGQFFDDLYDIVIKMVEEMNMIVYVYGLDGDFERKPFGKILDLIPICDSVEKLQSFCAKCKDATLALFSYRTVNNKDQKMIGTDQHYIPLCRKCFLK